MEINTYYAPEDVIAKECKHVAYATDEEKENDLLDRKANEIVDLVNKEDTIKEGSGSTKLNNIQKEFNKEHKMIVDEILEQHQQIQLTL